MRLIKFRAWDKKHGGVMVPVWRISFTNEGEPYCIDWIDKDERGNDIQISVAPDMFTLMQYTGLKDKNGKEIWEGDLVNNNESTWEVVFDDGMLAIQMYPHTNESSFESSFWLGNENTKSEVIGNVWEHPELLK